MKKIIAIISVLIFLMQVSVFAKAELTVSDSMVEGVIDGNISSEVSGEAVLLHIKDSKKTTVHMDEQYSADKGAYKFAFQINPYLGGGKYTYTVSTAETTEETGTIYVQDVIGIGGLCEAMAMAHSAEDIKGAFENLSFYSDNPAYESLDKSRFYTLFYDMAKDVSGLNAKAVTGIMEKIIFTETANQNKLEQITDTDGKIASINRLELSAEDLTYYNSINTEGLKNINKHLQGKSFSTVPEMTDALKGLIYVNCITNNTAVGIGNSKQIVDEKYSVMNIDISEYKDLSAEVKEEILRALVNSSAGSVSEFGSLFKQTVETYSDDGGSSGGFGGGSSGGGGFSGGAGGVGFIPTVSAGTAIVQPALLYDSGFSDMQGYDWAQEAVSILKDNKVINGKTKTTFAPSDSVTREEYLAMLLRAVSVQSVGDSADGPYAWVKGDSFDNKTVNLWSVTENGVKYEDGVMKIASSGGPVMQVKRYDTSNVLSIFTGDSAEAASAYEDYKIVMQTKMTVLSGESGYTEFALLDGTTGTKVHLVRLQRDGENTYKVLINQSSAGVNSGISNEILTKIPYGQMVDVCILIQGNVVEFYINGERAGATKYSTGIPTWSSGIKLYSDEGTAAVPFVGAFDDMAVYFHKGNTMPEFNVTEAVIDNGKLQIKFTTQPSSFSKWSILVNGEEKQYSVNPIDSAIEIDYPDNTAAKVSIVSGGKDIFGTVYDGETELQTSVKTVDKEISFTDVKETDWYYEAVNQALNYQIVNGMSDDVFGAGYPVTRQDMAVMAFRMLRYCNVSIDTGVEGISFTDDESIADYAKEYVKLLKKTGIINGYGDGSFKPNGTANRAEAAQIVYKLYKMCNTK